MLSIKLGQKTYFAPENWQECTPHQMRIFLLTKRIPPEHRKRAVMESLVQAYLGMTDKEWGKLILSMEQWQELKCRASWVLDESYEGKPFDFFDFEGERYYLPDDNFENTTALELSLANMQFLRFAHPTDPDLSALDELIATFCRPERLDIDFFARSIDWNGDIRVPFNQARAVHTAKRFTSLDVPTKVAFLAYFERMNNSFLEEYATLFGDSKEEPRYDDGTGWLMILKSVAKQNIWGNFDNVCRQPVRNVWAFMLDDVLDDRAEQKKLEEMHQNNGNKYS